MPSQEEYLDNLLKDLENIESVPKEEKEMESDLPLQNDFTDFDMSDMEELLAAAEQSATESSVAEDMPQEPIAAEEVLPELSVAEDVPQEPIAAEEVSPELPTAEPVSVEDTADMTEDDIEKLLAGSQEVEEKEEAEPQEEAFNGVEDVDELMRLLNNSDDEEVQDIHDMLQKSDNNEAVDDDIISMLQNADTEENFVPDFEAEEAVEELLDSKEKRAAEKKRRREEKKEAKKAAREAAREERTLKKAAKKKDKRVLQEAEETELIEETAEPEMVEPEPEEPEVAELEPDLLEALSVSDDMFAEALPDADMISPLFQEESDEGDVQELEVKDKTKKSFFGKILDFLTESDEDEEEKGGELLLSEENEAILKEMDKEKRKNKKGKKPKKKGKGGEDKSAENLEEEEKGSKKEKKPKKVKKPKKQKPPKVTEAEGKGRKLSKKRIILIMLICLSIGLVIILSVNVSSDYTSKRKARAAYYEGDYQDCFQNLYGRHLNETEQVMLYKSESILRIRVWLREYELLAQEGSELQALDSLIQSVDDYPELYEFASQWNAAAEVAQTYHEILQILSEKYHLTEEQAKEIASTPDDVAYTRMVMAIVDGEEFGSWDEAKESEAENDANRQELPDFLPEEEELSDLEFLDNGVK